MTAPYSEGTPVEASPPPPAPPERDKNKASARAVFLAFGSAFWTIASIKTTIPIHTEVPAKFNLPLDTDTVVVLSRDTRIPGARVTLNTGGLTIVNAPTDIPLPAGTRLPIHLTLQVPVDQKIPVNLTVAVNIPLNKTDLHQPFVGLQNLVAPYYVMVNNMPESWSQMLCGLPPNPLCKEIIP